MKLYLVQHAEAVPAEDNPDRPLSDNGRTTFLGVLLAYGFVGPVGANLNAVADAESKYYNCIKAGLMAHLQGYPPAVSVEFARKILFSHERLSFIELEQAVDEVQAV